MEPQRRLRRARLSGCAAILGLMCSRSALLADAVFTEPHVPEKRCQVAVVPSAVYSLNVSCALSAYWHVGASSVADIKKTDMGESDSSRILAEGPNGVSLPVVTSMELDQTLPSPVVFVRRLLPFADEDYSPFVSLIFGRGAYSIRERVDVTLHSESGPGPARSRFSTSAYQFSTDYSYNFVNASAGIMAHPESLSGFLFGAEMGFIHIYGMKERRHVRIDLLRSTLAPSISPEQAVFMVLQQKIESRRPQASMFLIPWIGYQVTFQ